MEDKVLSGMYLHHCLSFFGLFNVSSASAYVKTFKKRGRVAVKCHVSASLSLLLWTV